MAYIGIQPAEKFTSFATQEFSTSATTSYTLDHAVANENEIALFVNNVRQQPGSGKAYTASGTALTLSAATASTDTMYCVFLGRALQTVTPATNSITSSMLGSAFFTGATDVGAALADADLLLIDDGAGGTLRKSAASRLKTFVSGDSNDPSFHVHSPTNGNIATGTDTVIAFGTELFDSSSAYNTSTHKFIPLVAGYYFFYAGIRYQSSTTAFDRINLSITKNGSEMLNARNDNEDYNTTNLSGAIQLDGVDDYVQVASYQGSGSTIAITDTDEHCFFGGFLVKKS